MIRKTLQLLFVLFLIYQPFEAMLQGQENHDFIIEHRKYKKIVVIRRTIWERYAITTLSSNGQQKTAIEIRLNGSTFMDGHRVDNAWQQITLCGDHDIIKKANKDTPLAGCNFFIKKQNRWLFLPSPEDKGRVTEFNQEILDLVIEKLNLESKKLLQDKNVIQVWERQHFDEPFKQTFP